MKIRPLHEIDLARIAPLPADQQRRQLMQIRHGRPPFSYNPLRACFHDIFNVQPEMFSPAGATDWAVIETLLKRKCRSVDELKANLTAAKGLHSFARQVGVLGRAQEFFPFAMGAGQKVAYWLPMVLSVDGRPVVSFIDPRRVKGLTREGRRFAFSIMHERIRAADPDYEQVGLAIFQFGDVVEDQRPPIVHMDDGLTLFPLDRLEAMVSATYAHWQEVCEEREADGRLRGTGTNGPLI